MSENTCERVRTIIARVRHIPVESVSLDSSFEQLGIDSLEGVMLVFALEDEFHIEIPDVNGLQFIWSLNPDSAPSTDLESGKGQITTRIAGAITQQTPSAYRVTFRRTVTESGTTGTPEEETVDFPFGRVTRVRLFRSLDISGFYGNPNRRR